MFTSNYCCLHTGVPYNTAFGWNRPYVKAQCSLFTYNLFNNRQHNIYIHQYLSCFMKYTFKLSKRYGYLIGRNKKVRHWIQPFLSEYCSIQLKLTIYFTFSLIYRYTRWSKTRRAKEMSGTWLWLWKYFKALFEQFYATKWYESWRWMRCYGSSLVYIH